MSSNLLLIAFGIRKQLRGFCLLLKHNLQRLIGLFFCLFDIGEVFIRRDNSRIGIRDMSMKLIILLLGVSKN